MGWYKPKKKGLKGERASSIPSRCRRVAVAIVAHTIHDTTSSEIGKEVEKKRGYIHKTGLLNTGTPKHKALNDHCVDIDIALRVANNPQKPSSQRAHPSRVLELGNVGFDLLEGQRMRRGVISFDLRGSVDRAA